MRGYLIRRRGFADEDVASQIGVHGEQRSPDLDDERGEGLGDANFGPRHKPHGYEFMQFRAIAR